MAQFIVKFQESSTHTVMVEGVETLDEAKELISVGSITLDDGSSSWTDKVSYIKSDVVVRSILASDEVNI